MAQPGRRPALPKDARRIPVPAVALEQWLAEIDDPGELKVTLRVVAMLAAEPARGTTPPSLSLDDLLDDGALRRAAELGSDDTIRSALSAALSRETLLAIRVGGDVRLLGNDERAREYLAEKGSAPLTPAEIAGAGAALLTAPEAERPVPATPPRANIFAMYERHIGTFSHGTAEQLRAAEEEYPASWVEDAFAIASQQNVRSWGYVHAILRRWLQEGKPTASPAITERQRDQSHDDGKPGHDTTPDRRTGYLESYRRRHGRLPWEPDDADERQGG